MASEGFEEQMRNKNLIPNLSQELKEVIFTMEGQPEACHVMTEVFSLLGNKVLQIEPEKKSLYHCAASLVSNFMIGLYQMGLDLLEECGIGKEEGEELIQLQLLDQYYKEAANSASKEEGEDNEEEEDNPEQALKKEMAEAGLEESEEMAEQIEKMLEEQRIGDQVEMDINAQFVRLTLNGALLFDSGQSQIREDALPLVDKLSLILENYDSSLIDIEGHTDNVPINNEKFENNDVLSAFRAFAVKNYVLTKTTLEAGKINATGCGEYNPVADNGTPEGRARNRRVEIKIYNSYNSN